MPSPTSSHQDLIMALMFGQKLKDSSPKTVLFARYWAQKHNRNREKLFNFQNLVLIKITITITFQVRDK